MAFGGLESKNKSWPYTFWFSLSHFEKFDGFGVGLIWSTGSYSRLTCKWRPNSCGGECFFFFLCWIWCSGYRYECEVHIDPCALGGHEAAKYREYQKHFNMSPAYSHWNALLTWSLHPKSTLRSIEFRSINECFSMYNWVFAWALLLNTVQL